MSTQPTTVQDLKKLANNTGAQWWRDRSLRKLNCFIAVIWLAQVVSGFDGSLLGSLIAMASFKRDMGHPNSARVGVLQGMSHAGSLFGGWPGSFIADRWGRKWAMAFGCCIEIVGVIISTAGTNFNCFIAGRFFLGLGLNVTLSIGPSWASELAHPRQRGVISSCYNVLWYVGAILAAWISFGTAHLTNTWAWRIPSIIQAAPPFIILCFIFWLPESPRFLLHKDRTNEARIMLARLHANGNIQDELVEFEVTEISMTLRMEAEANAKGWNVLWSTRANLKRTLIACSLPLITNWCGQSVISYYYSVVLTQVGITTTTQQTGINGGLQIFNFLCSISGIFMAERFGRRTMWLLSFGLMIICNVLMIILSSVYAEGISSDAGYGVVVVLFLYDASFNIACNPLLYCYMVEILPYYMRTKASAVAVTFSALLLTFNAFVNSIALNAIGWKYYFVYLGLLFCWFALIYFFFPETKGLVLEDIAVQFEGDRAATVKAGINPDIFIGTHAPLEEEKEQKDPSKAITTATTIAV
ncbi:hypothetical protein A1O1_08757 [Capronia coronata CBS 617.96]|uniref:Major facilitator superfamily (MFS) profile domain-containing protein n=1 Tax=Capronia coronata CBS 617.96 TaxID=1182541 RepID=W9XH00_9EURO|nr:uncharacterized protein A1O1_08757 [Capronia coronata CBS 617.96]EXJ79493.1 hypothetical protein A1O1_08757 [Capronia coronata CBS 617.96]